MAKVADDEDVWESWEDMVDSGGLDERLEKEEQTLNELRKKEEITQTKQPPIVLEEDTHRTKYQPTLKLMRRPDDDEDSSVQETDVTETNKALTKTLAERQAEYEQARLRILGSAKNEEDDEVVDRTVEPGKTSKPTTNSKQSKPGNNSGKGRKQKNSSSKSKKGSSGSNKR